MRTVVLVGTRSSSVRWSVCSVLCLGSVLLSTSCQVFCLFYSSFHSGKELNGSPVHRASHPAPPFPGPAAAAPVLFPFLFLLSFATVEMEFPFFILLNGLYLMAIVKPSVFLVHTVLNIEIFYNYFYYFNTASFSATRKMSH